jgi:hypothetical protein
MAAEQVVGIIGMLLALVGGLWILFLAFGKGCGWGLACLLLPFVNLVFALMNLKQCWKPLTIWGIGVILLFTAAYDMKRKLDAGELDAEAEVAERQTGAPATRSRPVPIPASPPPEPVVSLTEEELREQEEARRHAEELAAVARREAEEREEEARRQARERERGFLRAKQQPFAARQPIVPPPVAVPMERSVAARWHATEYEPAMVSFLDTVGSVVDLRQRSYSSMEARTALADACLRLSQLALAARRAITPSSDPAVNGAVSAMLASYDRAAQSCLAGKFFELDRALTEGATNRGALGKTLSPYGLRP